MAYQSAPQEIIDTFINLVTKEHNEHERIFVTSKMEGCWDQRLADALLKKARDETLNPETAGGLLSDLLDHGVREATAIAELLIPLPPPAACDRRDRAITAARVLMTHADDAGWPVVWPAIQLDTAFGREVTLGLAQTCDRHAASVGNKLTEDQLLDLYLWLARQFPYAEDPQYDEVHLVAPRESMTRWRDALLRQLKERGTAAACQAIRCIMRELPLGQHRYIGSTTPIMPSVDELTSVRQAKGEAAR